MCNIHFSHLNNLWNCPEKGECYVWAGAGGGPCSRSSAGRRLLRGRTGSGLRLCSQSAPPAPRSPGSYSGNSVPGKTVGFETSPAEALSLQETVGRSPHLGEPHFYLVSKSGDKRDLLDRVDAENISEKGTFLGVLFRRYLEAFALTHRTLDRTGWEEASRWRAMRRHLWGL